ncbi:NPP1 family protein [Marinactinospora thermotolerans]|uniref:Necrosis inducing protein (NPP1) n=1 Tax=Marinactinospora thermotolerans DSM 45154 TaxID=1122192 RepID=A0A1T4KGD3_9ACTN|nr:NPP1 family protein [Marinactinospora thermotolerans]SJZ41472.1 Necrosis inducing protein (NPP1) [Marinactinospora thermotolerans DSM 45154]
MPDSERGNAHVSISGKGRGGKGGGRRGRFLFARSLVVAALLVLVPASPAFAAPPPALPANAPEADRKWQPAFDYDTDGCYPTPAIGPDGTLNGGLNTSGALNGNCRDQSDLDNTNSYSRSRCDDSGWCAYMYALYFEKDQTLPGCCGHRHDLEHVVVWVRDGQAHYVSASAHGDYHTRPASQVRWEGTHAKIVYHKDGASTHAFRFAAAHDDPPENHYGQWQYPDLVGWEGYPPGIRDRFTSADFGSATLDLKDGVFESALERARPAGIDFDPRQ